MVSPTVGAIVLVRFPFSDLSASKLRPALVLARADREDWILCQITSSHYDDPLAIKILDIDFQRGSLNRPSYARPGKLFTANTSLMTAEAGKLKPDIFKHIIAAVVNLLQKGLS